MEIEIEDREDYRGRFRMQGERRSKRMQKEKNDKYLLHAWREMAAINREHSTKKELDHPFQHGYVRFFVLRDDVKRSKHAAFYERILEKINNKQWAYSEEFLETQWVQRKLASVPLPRLRLRNFNYVELERAGFNKRERACFARRPTVSWENPLKEEYHFREAWRFVLVVKPHIVTWWYYKDPELEQRRIELERYFSHNDRKDRVRKLLHGHTFKWARYYGKPDNPRNKNPFACRSLADILSEHYPEPTLRINHKDPQSPGDFFWISRCITNKISHQTSFGHIRRVGVEPPSTTAPHPTGILKRNRGVYPLYSKDLLRCLSNNEI